MTKQINIVGHLNSSSGLGNAARLFIQVLKERGYSVAGLDVDYHPERESSDAAGVEMHRSVEELPSGVNLVILAIQLLPSVWLHRLPGLLAPRFKNIGMIFWELPVIPPAWVPALQLFDGIVVSSQYVRQAIEVAAPEVKTFFAEHPLQPVDLMRDPNATRAALELRSDDFVFSSSFDLRSDYSRKNPMAVLDSFDKAFAGVQGVRLLIKANGRAADKGENPVGARIMARIAGDPRIRFLSETLPYAEVMALHAAADVYVSLHRAEGLGLGLMEAMQLGKLVIATGYSGNMTFMSEQNSMPIPYRLIEPSQTVWQYRRAFAGPGSAWAEPDLEASVDAMRQAYENSEATAKLGDAARSDIARRQQTAWRAPFLDEMFRWLASRPASPNRATLRRRVAINEFLNPTLRRINAKAVASKLQHRLFGAVRSGPKS